jgi:hypothetical protein
MDWMNLIISLISGIAGGNAVGAAAPDKSLGGIGNSVTGLLGGGAGGYLLQALGLFAQAAASHGAAGNGLDIGSLLGNIAGSGVGGALLTYIVGLIKNASGK